MTTAREVVVNKALSGAELKDIMRRMFDRLLEGEGFLSDFAAFGRISYDIRLRLHMDNPQFPESTIEVSSRPPAWNELEKNPDLAALETLPLKNPSSESEVRAAELSHSIDSPNAERLRHGLPVPVTVDQQDGTKTMETVKYPPQPELGDGDVKVANVKRDAQREFGLKQDPLPPAETTSPAKPTLSDCCHCTHRRGEHALSGICTQCPKENPCNDFRDSSIPLPNKDAEKWPVTPT